MGVDKNVHVGPYLIVKPKLRPTETTIRACPRTHCHYEPVHDAKFCPVHGAALEFMVKKGEIQIVTDILYSARFEDQLYMPGDQDSKNPMVLLPNTMMRARSFRAEDDEPLAVTESLIKDEVQWFQAQYGDLISEIQKVSDQVDVQWGVYSYWN